MQISPKPKTFSQFFIVSMKSTLNSEYFDKKDQSHRLSITEIIEVQMQYISKTKRPFFCNAFLVASMKSTLNSEYFNLKNEISLIAD